MKNLGITLCLLTLCFSFYAQAEELESLQKKVNNIVSSIVKANDSSAFVQIDYDVVLKEQELPSLPFVYNTENKLNNEFQFNKVLINIYSKEGASVASVEDIIVQEVKKYVKIKPSFSYMQLPQTSLSESKNSKTDFSGLVWVVLGVISVVVISLIAWLQFKKLGEGKSIGDKLSIIANNIEQSLGGNKSAEQPKASHDTTKIEFSNDAERLWDSLSMDTLSAVLSDCYWCEEDEYASYIWGKISEKNKRSLLESKVIPSEYIELISSSAGSDLGYIKSSYYLKPSHLFHLSNSDLSILVAKDNNLANHISELRFNSLDLGIEDKINLTQKNLKKDFDAANIKFKAAPASNPRDIKIQRVMKVQSDQEDLAVMNMSPESKVASSILTIAWLSHLKESDLKKTLQAYNAQMLAEAWVGPEELLYKLKSHIPAGKYELVLSYVEKTQPSRASDAYNRLWVDACKNIKANEFEFDQQQKRAS